MIGELLADNFEDFLFARTIGKGPRERHVHPSNALVNQPFERRHDDGTIGVSSQAHRVFAPHQRGHDLHGMARVIGIQICFVPGTYDQAQLRPAALGQNIGRDGG
jgi:hypothetical protein